MRLYGATNSCPKVLDFPHYKVRGRTRTNGAIRSFEPVGNPALGEIVRRHFDEHFVAGELATILLPNCSVRSRIGQHQGAGRREIMADLLDTLLLGGMRCYRHCRTPKPGFECLESAAFRHLEGRGKALADIATCAARGF
jgi:hypothetical protein